MVVFGKVSSSAAAASRVISCAMIGLVSVIPEPSSWRQMNATVCDHNTRAEAETGAIDSNRRSAAGRRAPAPQLTFAPGHIPEHLQDDWYDQHFRHIGGNTRLLRRAAALRLVQMSAGGSLAEAAAFLGIDHRYLKASPGSAALAGDPAEFRLAVHALARQLSTTPGLINYKHRRDALQDWCLDPAAWQDIISQLPPTKGPFQPELSDCKRQFASEAVWARVTQGEHLLAPRIIEDQLSAGDPTWHRRRDSMWHCCNVSPAKPHYAALRQILNVLADNLADQIDER